MRSYLLPVFVGMDDWEIFCCKTHCWIHNFKLMGFLRNNEVLMYLLASVNIGTCTSCSLNGRRKSYDNVKEWALSSNAAITTINYLQDL